MGEMNPGVQAALDMMVLRWMAGKAKDSVKRDDEEAAMSAFLSDVADSKYAHHFPWLHAPKPRKRKVKR